MTPGLAGPLRRSVGLDVEGGRVWSSAVGEGPAPHYVNLFTTLRTITSIGAAVKAPPCMHTPPERSGPLTAGSGAMTSPFL